MALIFATGFAFLLSAGLTFVVRRLSTRLGIVDRPDGVRKLHSEPTPLGGGIALVASYIVTLLGVIFVNEHWRGQLLERSSDEAQFFGGFLLSMLIICAVGLIDDRFNLRGRQKLIGQVLAISVLIASGLVIRKFTIFDWSVDLGNLAIPFTAFWLLGAVNALNLIDGVDGLASSIGLIFSVALAGMAFATDHHSDALLAMVLAGSLGGFLIHNFPPARIFLGDSGSMLIGLVLGTLAIRSSLKGPVTVALAAPTAVWTVLIFDVSMAIVRRKLTGRSLYATDRGHLHHALMRKGVSGTGIVVWVGLLCALCSAGALASIFYQNDLLAIGSAMAVIAALVLTRFFGHAEVTLLVRTLKSFLRSFLHLPNPNRDELIPTGSRLQGDREWNLLWEGITTYAREHDLCLVQLSVALPSIHEDYHAVWKRSQGAEKDHMWQATLPLVSEGHTIGRLRLAGLAEDGRSMSEWLAELVAGLKPFEEHLLELAGLRERPEGVVEIPSPHSKPVGLAATTSVQRN